MGCPTLFIRCRELAVMSGFSEVRRKSRLAMVVVGVGVLVK
jgi:hypothetical protein